MGGRASPALAQEDFLRAFRAGLVEGVLPVFDCFAVAWVVCPVEIALSIREESVFGSEKLVCILLYSMIHKVAY
jgi:hypothetical protein